MRHLFLILAALLAMPAHAREPVIDMHLHANAPGDQGPPPQAMCTPLTEMATWDPRTPWLTFINDYFTRPACRDPIWSPRTDEEMRRRTFAELEKHNVFAALSGDGGRPAMWKAANPGRILLVDVTPPGIYADPAAAAPKLREAIVAARARGEMPIIGELGTQYFGIASDDPRLDPIWRVATEMDVPVSLHVGPGPPGTAYFPGNDKYRARHSSPLLLEEVMLKHPTLRLNVMHAGYPMLDDTLAFLYAHPQAYVEVGVIVYALPRATFYRYLRTLVEAGFGKRIMFGSDNMVWPETIGRAITSIRDAPFLSRTQKRDILYDNAARFLRLDAATQARHRAM